jgi:hypothetical protein
MCFQLARTRRGDLRSQEDMMRDDDIYCYLVLEHVEQGGLAGVVEAEEQDLGLLLPEPGQHVVEPLQQKHLRQLPVSSLVELYS